MGDVVTKLKVKGAILKTSQEKACRGQSGSLQGLLLSQQRKIDLLVLNLLQFL